VVALLRLSPLLPFAASNYLYGLTSVELVPYVAGSWLGMLPGTFAYVAAGSYGKDLLGAESGGTGPGNGIDGAAAMGSSYPSWQIGLAVVATAAVVWYVGKLAKAALAEVEEEEEEESSRKRR
jgi:uncharacterized membrane protein YdjX (TVP38/TMEM64 family)